MFCESTYWINVFVLLLIGSKYILYSIHFNTIQLVYTQLKQKAVQSIKNDPYFPLYIRLRYGHKRTSEQRLYVTITEK